MRGLHRLAFVLAVLCAFSLGLCLFLFFAPAPAVSAEPPPLYLLRDDDGRLALYAPGDPLPVRTYDVYTRLLPEPDRRRLLAGVEIFSEAQLQQRLEDYGL